MNRLTCAALLLAASLPLPTVAAPYQVVPVENGGRITGHVTFSGEDPAPRVFTVAKDNDTCGTGTREIDFVRVTNGALNDAVVYLDKVAQGKPYAAELAHPLLDQKGCRFTPFLGVMRNKDKLTVRNSDPVLHNIHTYEIIGRAKRTVFNVSQPADVKIIKKTVKLRRGHGMKVECDAHDFMHGFTFVTRNPYYAVVKDDGSFAIEDVPPGEYTIKSWHGILGEKKAKVTVTTGGSSTVDFGYQK